MLKRKIKLPVLILALLLSLIPYGKSEEIKTVVNSPVIEKQIVATWGIVDTGYASIDGRSIDYWMWPEKRPEDILWDALHWHWEWSPAWIYRHPKRFFLIISGLMLWLLFIAVRSIKNKLANR